MRVRATQTGYYDHMLRKPGDIFEIKGTHKIIKIVPETGAKVEVEVNDFSKNWMECVDVNTVQEESVPVRSSPSAYSQVKSPSILPSPQTGSGGMMYPNKDVI